MQLQLYGQLCKAKQGLLQSNIQPWGAQNNAFDFDRLHKLEVRNANHSCNYCIALRLMRVSLVCVSSCVLDFAQAATQKKQDTLMGLVRQSLRQAQQLGVAKTIAKLSDAVGSDCVAYMRHTHGSIRKFLVIEMDDLEFWSDVSPLIPHFPSPAAMDNVALAAAFPPMRRPIERVCVCMYVCVCT